MVYLLDANVLIDASRDYYPLNRVPEFWDWMLAMAEAGSVKVPLEIWDEVADGHDELASWLKREAVKRAILLPEEVDVDLLRRVVAVGYAADLDDTEIEKLGRDPFLIAHAIAQPGVRCVVTTEASRPSAQRSNRRVPDVCRVFQVDSIHTFEMTRRLDFSTNWRLR